MLRSCNAPRFIPTMYFESPGKSDLDRNPTRRRDARVWLIGACVRAGRGVDLDRAVVYGRAGRAQHRRCGARRCARPALARLHQQILTEQDRDAEAERNVAIHVRPARSERAASAGGERARRDRLPARGARRPDRFTCRKAGAAQPRSTTCACHPKRSIRFSTCRKTRGSASRKRS